MHIKTLIYNYFLGLKIQKVGQFLFLLQEIIFTQTRMFGYNEKYNFPEIIFLLTRIYTFDPKMNLHSHFHFNSFPGHAKRTATQREREKRNTKRIRTQRERELRSIFLPLRAPIQPPRPPT